MQKIRRILMASLLMLTVCILFTGCASKANIGYVDFEKVAQCPQVKAINAEYQKEYEPLVAQMNELAQKQKSMSPQEYEKDVQALQRKAMGIREKYMAKNQSLIMGAVSEIAKEKKLSVVTTKAATAINLQAPAAQSLIVEGTVAEGGIDITQDVVKKLQ